MDFYGDRSADEPINEESGPGASFLAGVCVAWEAEAARLGSLGVRVVLLRIGYVIDRNALAFRLLSDPVRLGIGTFLGPGDRPFTWIHLDDVVGLVRLAIQDQAMVGPVNAIAPSPSTLDEVIAAVGRQLGRRIRLRIPGRLLRFVMHDQADLLLHGRTATPRAALTHGYAYLHPTLDDALRTSLDRDRIDPPITSSSPFDRVFSPQDRAGLPAVLHQQYFPTDTVSFTGAMDRVWRRRRVLWPAFRMLSPFRVLFAETGFGVPAKLTVRPTSAGPAQMAVWEREFHFPRSTRHFDGVLAWDHTRQQVVERTGPRGFLESPLRVAVAINAVRIESTATRLRLRGKSVTLPQIVAVRAVVKEWVEMQDPDTIHVVLEISHPLLGPVFGYEGRLTLDR